jgi:hypothetical protein
MTTRRRHRRRKEHKCPEGTAPSTVARGYHGETKSRKCANISNLRGRDPASPCTPAIPWNQEAIP